MKPNWLSDGRLIPDEVMSYLPKIAVHAVEEHHFSPEDVTKMLGLSPSTIYAWLKRYREQGYAGLDTKKAPGAPPLVTEEMDAWLKRTVLDAPPEDFGYDTPLWTCDLLAELISERYGVHVIGATINQHLHKLGLVNQTPNYIPREQDPVAVDRFIGEKFHKFRGLRKRSGPISDSRTKPLSTCASTREKPGVRAVSGPMSKGREKGTVQYSLRCHAAQRLEVPRHGANDRLARIYQVSRSGH
jgi:transposase